ncbi:hypothetical protein DIPPA_21549 [Diplonema papillatum]|nr:hypothetical protein DIPPA_21549 [Diplonema papillatum]|eukprot:gene11590-17858_t
MRSSALRALPALPALPAGVNLLGDHVRLLPEAGLGETPKDEYVRMDKKGDDAFYRRPRFDGHMRDVSLNAITLFYDRTLGTGEGKRHLDLCSSFSSHFPANYKPEAYGLGMNSEELVKNQSLSHRLVHDLNKDPKLPFDDQFFDVATNVASVEYLKQPLTHFDETRRVLKPGAPFYVIFTNRAFWTKSVALWKDLTHEQRILLVASYFTSTGYQHVEAQHIVPPSEDPDAEPVAVVIGRA